MSSDRKSGFLPRKKGGAAFHRRKERGERQQAKSLRRDPSKSDERDVRRPDRLWIYGRHAGLAAIANPQRKIKRIVATEAALDWIGEARLPLERVKPPIRVDGDAIDRMLDEGAVHQGLAVEVDELPRARLREACLPDGARPVVVLDQITDPHNIGAIFRSAAAFGAKAIIVQDRRTPPLAGALAKAAAGAVETVPCVPVVNSARALEGLKSLGYLCVGLVGEAPAAISELPKDRPVAFALGAEGAGLRKLVRETCDMLVRIPMQRGVESLNVSIATAIALYEFFPGAAEERGHIDRVRAAAND